MPSIGIRQLAYADNKGCKEIRRCFGMSALTGVDREQAARTCSGSIWFTRSTASAEPVSNNYSCSSMISRTARSVNWNQCLYARLRSPLGIAPDWRQSLLIARQRTRSCSPPGLRRQSRGPGLDRGHARCRPAVAASGSVRRHRRVPRTRRRHRP